jgi:hypothetical protein
MKDTEPDLSLSSSPEDGTTDVEDLKVQLHQAEQELARTKGKLKRRKRGRSFLTGLLVVLTSLVFTLAITAGWTRRTLFNTDQYVRTVAPIVEHDSVTRVLSERLTSELLLLINADELVAEALPPRAVILSGPIVGAIEDFVGDRVRERLESDQFAERWANINRFAHTQIMAVLRGEGGAVLTTESGTVTLNLLPVINEILVRVEERASGLIGQDIDIPEITEGEVPEEARVKIEAAFGVDVPEDFGEIVVFQSDKLEAAQDALKTIDKSVIVLLVLAILLIPLTLWASRRRRRTLIQLCTGILIGMVVVRRLVMFVQDEVVDLAKPENRDAAQAIVDDLMRNFFRLTAWVIVIGLVTIAVALLTGPYPWAAKLRARSRSLVRSVSGAVGDKAHDDSITEWVREHRDALQIGGAVFLVLLLLLFDLSWLGFFVVAALVGLFELAVYRIGENGPQEPEPAPPGDSAPPADSALV